MDVEVKQVGEHVRVTVADVRGTVVVPDQHPKREIDSGSRIVLHHPRTHGRVAEEHDDFIG